MIGWYESMLENPKRTDAAIQFTRSFLQAPASERAAIVSCWDPEIEWRLPNPWRLACPEDGEGSSEERIVATLLFCALDQNPADCREFLMGLAVVYNSCVLAGLNPDEPFELIASALEGEGSSALLKFLQRDSKDKSLEAFMLTARPTPDGGFELSADW